MLNLLALIFGGLKFGKVFLTVGSMLVSLGAYAWLYGWRYAAGFIVLLFVHEMGHFIAARQRGLDVGAPTFIPFLGAWIELREHPHDAETEAYIGLAGPLVGTLGALACYFLARQLGPDAKWLMAVAYAGFFLNLFNLIPVSPLDGGRVTAVLSPKLWLLGAPVLLGLLLIKFNPLNLVLLLLIAPQFFQAWRYSRNPEHAAYYVASAETRLTYGTAYVGLVGFLCLMTHEVHLMLTPGAAV